MSGNKVVQSSNILSAQSHYKLVAFFCAILIIFFPLKIAYFISIYKVNIPNWDEWGVHIPFLQNYFLHSLHFHDLFLVYGMHRVPLIKLFTLLNVIFFSGNVLSLLILQVFIQASVFLTVAFQFNKIISFRTKSFWLTLILFSALLFAPSMGMIWLWEFLLGQTLVTLFFIMAVFALNIEKYQFKNLLLSSAFAVGATASLFNGLIIWPTILIILLINRAPWHHIFLFGFLSIFIIVSYVHGIKVSNSIIDETVMERIHYFFCFIGAVFSDYKVLVATLIGVVAFLLYVTYTIIIFTNKISLQDRKQLIPWLAISMLTFGSAILGAVGRGGGPVQAMSDRYIVLAIPFWISLIVCSVFMYKKFKLVQQMHLNVVTFLLISFLWLQYFLTGNVMLFSLLTTYQQWVKIAAFALEQNVYIVNPSMIFGYLNPNFNAVLSDSNFLKQHKLYLFNDKASMVIGSNVKHLGLRIMHQQIPGNFVINNLTNTSINTCAASFRRGFFVTGNSPKHIIAKKKFNEIYILDSQGTIYGLGEVDFLQEKSRVQNWSGFVVSDSTGKGMIHLRAYAKAKDDNDLYPIPKLQSLSRGLDCTF